MKIKKYRKKVRCLGLGWPKCLAHEIEGEVCRLARTTPYALPLLFFYFYKIGG
jgi:hypothetical protein